MAAVVVVLFDGVAIVAAATIAGFACIVARQALQHSARQQCAQCVNSAREYDDERNGIQHV